MPYFTMTYQTVTRKKQYVLHTKLNVYANCQKQGFAKLWAWAKSNGHTPNSMVLSKQDKKFEQEDYPITLHGRSLRPGDTVSLLTGPAI